MIRKIVLPGFLLMMSINGVAQNQFKVIAIGFYNCESLFDTIHDPGKKDEDFTPDGLYHYSGIVYKQKLHNIATVIKAMGTDVTPDGPAILGMAEVENENVLNDLVDQPEIKNRHYKYTWFSSPDENGMSTALLYNPKYLKVLNAEPLHVPLETIKQKRPTRDVLHIYGIMAGDTVHILLNHWPSNFGGEVMSGRARVVAAELNKQIVDSLLKRDPNTKILVLGDLNDNPDCEGVVDILNAKAEKNEVGLTDIYNPWIRKYKKGLGTEMNHVEWALPDQIMISGAFIKNNNEKWKYYNAEIYNPDFLINTTVRYKGQPHRSFTAAHIWDNGYSDHFPVLMYLVEKN